MEQDCVEKEIECPFVKYKCVGVMKRKNLRNHLDGKRMEHLELKVNTMQECMLEDSEIIAKQKETISKQGVMIETMSRENISFKKEVEILTYLSKAIKLDWRITKVPESGYSIQKQFQVAGYNFLFCSHNSSYNLLIGVFSQTGPNNDKLKWPFKAEFVTHLSSQSNPGNIK